MRFQTEKTYSVGALSLKPARAGSGSLTGGPAVPPVGFGWSFSLLPSSPALDGAPAIAGGERRLHAGNGGAERVRGSTANLSVVETAEVVLRIVGDELRGGDSLGRKGGKRLRWCWSSVE